MSRPLFFILLISLSHGFNIPDFPAPVEPQPPTNDLDALSYSIAHMRGAWFTYIRTLNDSDVTTLATDLCFSRTFDKAMHQVVY